MMSCMLHWEPKQEKPAERSRDVYISFLFCHTNANRNPALEIFFSWWRSVTSKSETRWSAWRQRCERKRKHMLLCLQLWRQLRKKSTRAKKVKKVFYCWRGAILAQEFIARHHVNLTPPLKGLYISSTAWLRPKCGKGLLMNNIMFFFPPLQLGKISTS